MAKFIKSIFSEKRKTSRMEDAEDKDFAPPLDGRRKLSISRSGRMKQSRKKRNSLTLDLYGDDIQIEQIPKSLEYCVGATPANTPIKQENRNLENYQKINNIEPKSPEEEIDIAFEIIDKT